MSLHAVTQRINFCYGHRLLNYEGRCAHAHGHNAVAELTFEATKLDSRGMVVDFVEIKDRLRAWITQNLDHRMMLRRDDPLVEPLRNLGEPVFLMDGNPTAENIAQLIFEQAEMQKLPIVEVKFWETPTQFATFRKT